MDNSKNVTSSERSEGKKRTSRKKEKQNEKDRELEPLKETARRIALMLCEFSAERELFVHDSSASERRLDTKTLKEFSSVLKEISAVFEELNGGSQEKHGAVRIEFSEDLSDFCN